MNSTVNILDGLRREMVITMSFDELQPHFQKAYAAMQAEAQIDGFRKGKVPMNIIKSRYGKAIEHDALGDVADSSFQQSVKDQELEVAGVPMLRESTRTDDKGAHFVIEYEVYPSFALREFHEIEIEKPTREISDDDVERELHNILLRTSKLETADAVSDTNHVVKLKFSEIDHESGTPLLGGKEREIFLEGENVDPILRNDCLNLKRGDSFRYTEHHAAGEHGDHEHSHEFQVSVVDIQRVVLPELSKEYIAQITGGSFETEEELRADIKKSLQNYWDREVKESLRDQLVDKMISAHEFDVPKSLVALTAQDMIEEVKRKNPDDAYLKRAKAEDLFEDFLPNAEQSVRWQLIADRIIKSENLSVEEANLDELAAGMGVEKEMIRVALEKNKQLEGRLLTDRLFDFLFERVLTTEIPYEELMLRQQN